MSDESPLRVAKRLGIAPLRGVDTATYSQLLDWSVIAYWRKRAEKARQRREAA